MIFLHKKSHKLVEQQGVTLITTLIFLLVMTIVVVSASKMSIMNIMVSSNNQRQMELFQLTENDLKLLTTPVSFYEAYTENIHHQTWEYHFPNDIEVNTKKKVESRDLRYQCGGFNGLAVSMGPDVSECYLYDFSIKASVPNSGVRDKHLRGAGKEFPNPSRNSAL